MTPYGMKAKQAANPKHHTIPRHQPTTPATSATAVVITNPATQITPVSLSNRSAITIGPSPLTVSLYSAVV
jgi:hypothetical protein